jgi:hypothetical protein
VVVVEEEEIEEVVLVEEGRGPRSLMMRVRRR